MARAKENLRSGYTTGACAAAAAKAALVSLIRQQAIEHIDLVLPNEQQVRFVLHSCSFSLDEGRASVIKDAGDDPDVTHQAEVCACVTWGETPGVSFRRGVGVGLVTKPGLPVPPGEPAINPAPRRLIERTLAEVLGQYAVGGRGVIVEISVPHGEELARKTFNPRLGIVGGISILGTTGIVVPYSTSAWLASVVQGIDVAVAQGCTELVLTIGERSERFARRLFDLPEVAFVQMGPFFGESLRHCAGAGVSKVNLCAMVGKLAKFAAGHESVHSSNSVQDFAFLADIARQADAGPQLIESISQANTAQEVATLVVERGPTRFFELICLRAWEFARKMSDGKLLVDVFLTSQTGEVLAQHPSRQAGEAV